MPVAEIEKMPTNFSVRAKALENRMESLYRKALRTLLESFKSLQQVVNAFKMRETYRRLSNAAARVGKAAACRGTSSS